MVEDYSWLTGEGFGMGSPYELYRHGYMDFSWLPEDLRPKITPVGVGGGTGPGIPGSVIPVGTVQGDFKVVLADDFSNGYQTSVWGHGFDGGTYWNGAFDWSKDDVNVRNGELQVTMTNHGGHWTAGGFSSFKAGNTITYGTVEFDARVEKAQGTQTAILMWPKSDEWPQDGEIDILEAPKGEAMHSTHWDAGGHQYSSKFSDVDPSQNNHYKMIWLPDLLSIEVNGREVARWTDPAAIPDGPMGFGVMGYVGAHGEDWVGGAPDGSTPDVVTVHVDNVVLSQYLWA